MILYFDENLPKHLAKGYQVLQKPEGLKTGDEVEVKFIPDEFKHGAKDMDWIPKVGNKKGCVVTQDIKISRKKHELELYRQYGLGIFFLRGPSKKRGMTIWQMVEALASNWPDIIHALKNEKRPFAYEVRIRGKMKKLP